MTHITPPPSDDDLPDERELAALYARLPKAEPDASLDAAVLAEATRVTPVSRRPRWPVAMASAAVLVLAVGVAWQVREQQPRLPTMPAPSTPMGPSAAAPAPAAADMRAADGIAAEAAPTKERRKSASVGADSLGTPSAGSPSVGSPSVGNPSVGAASVGAASAAKPAQRAQTPAHRSTPPAIAARLAPAPAAPPSPIAPAEPADAPQPVAAPAPAAPEAAMVSAEPQRDESAQAAPSGVLGASMAAKVAIPTSLGPDDRVGEIRRLLGRGERVQARRELTELRRRYPRYDLPQDLRDLNP